MSGGYWDTREAAASDQTRYVNQILLTDLCDMVFGFAFTFTINCEDDLIREDYAFVILALYVEIFNVLFCFCCEMLGLFTCQDGKSGL